MRGGLHAIVGAYSDALLSNVQRSDIGAIAEMQDLAMQP